MSRLALSRAISSSYVNLLNRSVSLRAWRLSALYGLDEVLQMLVAEGILPSA